MLFMSCFPIFFSSPLFKRARFVTYFDIYNKTYWFFIVKYANPSRFMTYKIYLGAYYNRFFSPSSSRVIINKLKAVYFACLLDAI